MISLQSYDMFMGQGNAALAGGIMAVIAAFFVLFLIIALALYVYLAFAWMTIARKLKYKKPWIAWIPIVNFFLLPILAKKEWPWGFLLFIPIVNIVFMIIWTWNVYEQRKYPGWLSLIWLGGFIPAVGWLASIASLVITGIVAWADR